MTVVVLDTDFVIKITNDPLPKFGSDVLEKSQLVTLNSVVSELNGLAHSKSPGTARKARNTMNALNSLARIRVIRDVVEPSVERGHGQRRRSSAMDADIELVEYVRREPRERLLATLDGSLLSRMERMGLSYLTLRNDRAFIRAYSTSSSKNSKKRRQHI